MALLSFVGNRIGPRAKDARADRIRARQQAVRRMRPVLPDHRVELWYLGQLNSIVADLRAAGRRILAAARPLVGGAQDAIPRTLKHEIAKAREATKVGKGAGADVATKLAGRSLDQVDARLSKNVAASIGVDIRAGLGEDPATAAAKREAIRENVELIVSIPDQYFDDIERVVEAAWDQGLAYDKIAEAVEQVGHTTESRAELIARDQTSKLNAKFNEARQTAIGIEEYEWQTVGDGDRVRDSHQDLDGRIFRWDSPPMVDGERAHPGEPINCRCTAAPVLNLDVERDVEDYAEAA